MAAAVAFGALVAHRLIAIAAIFHLLAARLARVADGHRCHAAGAQQQHQHRASCGLAHYGGW
jgi:hypothetical protein